MCVCVRSCVCVCVWCVCVRACVCVCVCGVVASLSSGLNRLGLGSTFVRLPPSVCDLLDHTSKYVGVSGAVGWRCLVGVRARVLPLLRLSLSPRPLQSLTVEKEQCY